jgi:hypothetical protein
MKRTEETTMSHPINPQTRPNDEELFLTRYPHFNVLDKWATADWDDQTREAIRRRLEEVPPIRFLTPDEVATLEAIVERIIPQPDRPTGEKIPIVPWIDEKLFENASDGYRFEVLPPQRQSWKLAIAGIEETSRVLFGAGFTALDTPSQDMILKRVQQGDPPGETWMQLPSHVFFSKVLTVAVVKTYYAHPASWNEIGYHGPSSPRGYSRIWDGGVDPWDAQVEGQEHDTR